MHLLPTTANLAKAVGEDYPLQVLPNWEYLSRTVRRNSYLLVQGGADLNYIVNPQGLPPRYLRTKAAEQCLDDVTLADWQAFPSYDLIREGKEAIQHELQLAWQVKWELRQRIFSPRFRPWTKACRGNDEISLTPRSQSVC
jgi:hypothetical protein